MPSRNTPQAQETKQAFALSQEELPLADGSSESMDVFIAGACRVRGCHGVSDVK